MGLLFRRRRPIARLAAGGEAHRSASPPPDYIAPPPASTGGEVDELARLVQMHEDGALTDEEFTIAKAQLLGI
jgi:hypothetical protein